MWKKLKSNKPLLAIIAVVSYVVAFYMATHQHYSLGWIPFGMLAVSVYMIFDN